MRIERQPLLNGLIAATFTPLLRDGELNLEKIPQVVDHLLASGVTGMYVLGSTGEGLSLTVNERQCVAEAFVTAAARRLPTIVQVGCESLNQARLLAEHAQSIGADAISAVSPVYFKPDTLETLVSSMAEIARGAPKLPFYYYHIPGATGVRHNMPEFIERARNEIPTFRGIKYTSTDVDEFHACVEVANGDIEMIWGVDEMLVDGLSAGATAAIGSTYNFATPIYQQLRVAFAAGDTQESLRHQARSQAIVNAFLPFGSRPAQKAIMAMVGPDCGPCRLPLKALSASQTSALRASLANAGFFDEHAPSPLTIRSLA